MTSFVVGGVLRERGELFDHYVTITTAAAVAVSATAVGLKCATEMVVASAKNA